MLDENTVIPKPVISVLEWQVLTSSHASYVLNLEHARQLIHGKASWWHIIIVGLSTDGFALKNLVTMCGVYGLGILSYEVITPGVPANLEYVNGLADVVYAPSVYKHFPAIQPRLRPPANAQQAIEVILYFSASLIPFNTDNYYQFFAHGS